MPASYSEADFDRLSWHDSSIRSFAFCGSTEPGETASSLVLDLDFILEWICGDRSQVRFRVAPATLEFQGITDLAIHLTWRKTGYQVVPGPLSIDKIARELVRDQKVYLDRPYWKWWVHLNEPPGSQMTFGALGFTLTLRSTPVVSDEQGLSTQQRSGLLFSGTRLAPET